ncbi:hypothetical protein ACS0TY_013684 [Phlomoides rotata]
MFCIRCEYVNLEYNSDHFCFFLGSFRFCILGECKCMLPSQKGLNFYCNVSSSGHCDSCCTWYFLFGLVGSIIIVIGFYSVMWGKAKDVKLAGNSIDKSFDSTSANAPLLSVKDEP